MGRNPIAQTRGPGNSREEISTQRAKPASAGGRPQRRPTAKRRPSGGFMPPRRRSPAQRLAGSPTPA